MVQFRQFDGCFRLSTHCFNSTEHQNADTLDLDTSLMFKLKSKEKFLVSLVRHLGKLVL